MKILLLAPQPFFQERGTPIAVKLLAETLSAQGHDVHLLVFAEGKDITLEKVTLHRHGKIFVISGVKPGLSAKKLLCDVSFFFKAISLLRKHKFDIVHAVEESVFMALVFKKIFAVPYVCDMDSCMSAQILDKFPRLGFLQKSMQYFEKKAVSGSAGVMAVCNALADVATGYSPAKFTTVIEDISLLDNEQTGDEDLRKQLNVDDGIVFMYVGNLETYQGIDLLLQAFALACTRKTEKNLFLLFIGGSDDYLLKYRKQVKEQKLESKVFFCGPRPVSLLAFYLAQADILVSPRVQGGNTPMKIYSYLDSGRPVLATNLETHTQVLDSEIACLVKAKAEDMADAMIALAGDKALRERIAKNASQRVQEEYSPLAFQRKLKSFYRQIACNINELEKNKNLDG
jgi:glycosyltransferase involved in cell wall biosynthesis